MELVKMVKINKNERLELNKIDNGKTTFFRISTIYFDKDGMHCQNLSQIDTKCYPESVKLPNKVALGIFKHWNRVLKYKKKNSRYWAN